MIRFTAGSLHSPAALSYRRRRRIAGVRRMPQGRLLSEDHVRHWFAHHARRTTTPTLRALAREWIDQADEARPGFAERLRIVADDAGQVVVAQLSPGGARFWMQLDGDSSPAALGGISARMIVIVADPDQLFERAAAAGATQVAPMHDAYGWRTARMADPFGHHWEFATPLAATRQVTT